MPYTLVFLALRIETGTSVWLAKRISVDDCVRVGG